MTVPATLPPLPAVSTDPLRPDEWGQQLVDYLTALAAITAQAEGDAAAAQANAAAAVTAVQTATTTGLATTLRATPAQVEYDWAASAWPLRSTVTDDALRVVVWRGPSFPPTGNGYALPGLDEYKRKDAQ